MRLAALTLSILIQASSVWSQVNNRTENTSKSNRTKAKAEQIYFVDANEKVFKLLFSGRDISALSTLPLCYKELEDGIGEKPTKISNLTGKQFFDKMKSKNYSALQVGLNLQIIQLVDLDEKSQSLSMVISTYKYWQDCRLKWNYSTTNLDHLELAPQMFRKLNIFTPGIRLLEALNPKENADSETDVSIYVGGHVTVMEEYMTQFSCGIDVSMYPFDIQQCYLTFESVLNEKFIDILSDAGGDSDEIANFIFGRYTASDQWSLTVLPPVVSHRNACTTQKRSCLNEGLKYRVILRRNPNYQLLNLFFPAFFIVVLSSCVFVIPPGAGDKMGLSVSILLSLYMFSQLMYDKMPESNAFPLLSQYFLVCILLVTASCVYSALSAIFVSACPRLPTGLRNFVVLLGPIFIFDLLKRPHQKLPNNKSAKDSDGNGTADSIAVEGTGAVCNNIDGEPERDFEGFRLDNPNKLTWAAFGALLDRLFFVAHLLATLSVMVAYLIFGYVPWTGYSALNLNATETEHVCAQLAVQNLPSYDLPCKAVTKHEGDWY